MTMLWVKGFHIFFFTSWFAGIFYLPRLFVYHAMSEEPVVQQQLAVMERKLYRFITPIMWLTVALGLWMLYEYAWSAYASMGWLHTKLVLVALLIGYHFYCGRLLRQFAAGKNPHSHVWYRWFNEIPVFILLPIALLTIVKPF